MANQFYIFAKTLLEESGETLNKFVKIDNGKIVEIGNERAEELKVIEVDYLAPGLIDTHVHGNTGKDTMDSSYESINQMSIEIASYGVTAFCPTTLTAPKEKIAKALSAVNEARIKGVLGAEVIGAFVEGPYFTETHRGAHPVEFMERASDENVTLFTETFNESISTIALAPEIDENMSNIPKFIEKGIRVAIAHTDSDYETCMRAFDFGASVGVHLFNGMKGLHHREPGTVGAILRDDRVYAELIADGHHVHPDVIELVYRCKGKEKLILISDAMRATGMEDGVYQLGELSVVVESGIARTSYGSLAGSTLKLIDSVFNVEKWTSASLEDAIYMASMAPAKSLGIDDEMGSISIGKKANLIAIENRELSKTWVEGKLVFDREEQ
ncbi:MAG: N-acetylglucosamine-6-phosphate deacetylase [Tissierellales bacterium]|jgi:N-acetylglucosamine-6-phosphate deacetylase|nr:N-acetylglucosamine-6-phosphate deacetylase [Tissierellales bacterium]